MRREIVHAQHGCQTILLLFGRLLAPSRISSNHRFAFGDWSTEIGEDVTAGLEEPVEIIAARDCVVGRIVLHRSSNQLRATVRSTAVGQVIDSVGIDVRAGPFRVP